MTTSHFLLADPDDRDGGGHHGAGRRPSATPALSGDPLLRPLETALEQARRRIEVSDAELAEARTRRDAMAAVLRACFPGARIYVNGSIAHGDALTPLTDVDLGVVVPDPASSHGPARRGPSELQQRAAAALRAGLKEDYGDLVVEVAGRKRSILVRFRDPVAPGRPDFTADVIVAIDNPGGAGLFIPRYQSWDRSHPEGHTAMVLAAIESSLVMYAKVVRLLKHWNRRNGKTMCSWHIKALALGCLTRPGTLLEGLQRWFQHAETSLRQGDTPDPARVAPQPIKTNKPRGEVVRRLQIAGGQLQEAINLQRDGYPALALDTLAQLFNDEAMLPRPEQDQVRAEEARRLKTRASKARKAALAAAPPAAAAPLTSSPLHTRPSPAPLVRSWAP